MIPKQFGGISSLKERSKKAFSESQLWESILNDAYDYFLPNRNLYDRDDAGQKKMDKIYDETAPIAIQDGASKLQENIAPIWGQWAMLEISKELVNDAEAQGLDVDESKIRDSLESQTEVIFDYINRSNFHTQFYEMALDLLIGTGSIQVDEVEGEDVITFHAKPQINIAFEEGPDGSIETHWSKRKEKARDLKRLWKGFSPSKEMEKVIEKDPCAKITCYEGVVYEPTLNEYHGVVWCNDEDHISWHYNYGDSKPIITGRYSKVSGEVRGRGPALMVLPAVKTLNKMSEYTLQKAALDLSGMWMSTDDGVTNPYSIEIAPGIVIPVGSNNSSNPSIMRLDTSGDINLSLFKIEEIKQNIKVALFNDIRDPDGPVRSATEISIEYRQLVQRIGSAYGRIQTELLIPILKRVMFILTRRGKIDPVVIDGKTVDIKFTSPLARAKDSEDIINAQQAVEFVMNTAGPEQVMLGFKVEYFGRWVADKTGMPAELVRTKDEVDERIAEGKAAVQKNQEMMSGQ